MALPDRTSACDSSAAATLAHDDASALDDLSFVELSEIDDEADDWLRYAASTRARIAATRARIAAVVARYTPRSPSTRHHPPVVIPPLGTAPPPSPRRLASGTRPGKGLFELDDVDLHELMIDELVLDDHER